jgi:hypothetical protein
MTYRGSRPRVPCPAIRPCRTGLLAVHQIPGAAGRGKVWDHKRHEHDLVLCPGSGQVVDLPAGEVFQLEIPGVGPWIQETLGSADLP